MNSITRTGNLFLLVLAAGLATVSPAPAATVAGFKVVHSFTGVDGGSPNSLIQSSDGFFYGSAANGGDVNSCPSDGCGVLFKSDSAYILAPRRRRSAAALPWLRPRSRGLPDRSISGKGA